MTPRHNHARRLLLPRQAWQLLWGRLLRWRLETYGLYMPSLPNRRPWWRVNRLVLLALLSHRRAYGEWLAEMDAARRHGPGGWWQHRLGEGYPALQGWIDRGNGTAGEIDDRDD